jgi:hypothetical protein
VIPRAKVLVAGHPLPLDRLGAVSEVEPWAPEGGDETRPYIGIWSNVPAVLVFRPFIPHLADPRRAWLTLAMSSTMAGNLTVLGSVANLIVLQRARHQVKITFSEYMRVGAPLTLVTIVIGLLWLG